MNDLPKDTYEMCCHDCHEKFEIEFITLVDVNTYPELKDKVIDGTLYMHKCPHCGYINFFYNPSLYVDSKNQVMIQQGNIPSLVEYYNIVVKEQIKEMQEQIPELIEYKQIGAEDYVDLVNKILFFEHGLDYRIATIYQVLMEEEFAEHHKSKNGDAENKPTVVNSCFEEKDGNLSMCIYYFTDEKRENKKKKTYPFNKKIYDDIKDKYSNELDKVFTYCFTRDMAKKFLKYQDQKYSKQKDFMMEVAVVDIDEKHKIMAFVPEFKEGQFKEHDEVCLMKSQNITKGVISSIFRMSIYELPYCLDEIPVIAYKLQNIQLKPVNEYIDKVVGNKMWELYKDNQEIKHKDYEMIGNSNIILGEVETFNFKQFLDEYVNDCIDGKFVNKKGNIEVPIGSYDTEYLTLKNSNDGHRYLCIYIEKKELSNSQAKGSVYKFDDVVRLVLNNPDKYSGIVINPESNKIFIPNKKLVHYKSDRIMLNSNRMRELLDKLTPEEINYLEPFNYEVIRKVYFEETSPKKIAEDLGRPFEDIHYALGYGYWYLKVIIWDNY